MEKFGLLCLFLVLTVITCIFGGYTLSILWGWFIVPTFSLPQLSIPVAIGISIIINKMTKNPTQDKENEGGDLNEQLVKSFFFGVFMNLFALLMGWIVTLFM